jgi:phosphatidylserine/phosphatidylglycerophosphate/cardiolipin synthase-like enzyme
MSNLTAIAESLVDITGSESEVDAVIAAIEFCHSKPGTNLDPATLTSLFDGEIEEKQWRTVLFAMEQATVLDAGALDRERLRSAAGAAKVIHSRGGDLDNEVVVTVPQEDDQDIGQELGSLVVRLVELLASADEEIIIFNPFFTRQVFGNLVGPIRSAIDRDVEVTLITRYLTYGNDDDGRAFVREIVGDRKSLENLTLYEYINPDEESTATIHAKMTIVDRRRAYLGTANLTHRGLHENLEVGVIFADETVNQLVRFTDDLRDSAYLHEVSFRSGVFERV